MWSPESMPGFVRDCAGIMGISETLFKVNLHRARQHMKKYLEGRCSLGGKNGQCRCSGWAGYVRKTGGNPELTKKSYVHKDLPGFHEIIGEMGFISRLELLYGTEFEARHYDALKSILKDMVDTRQLKIFS